MWMNLGPIIQNEESQRRKTNIVYQCIYMGPRKNSTDEPICRAEAETQYRTDLWTQSGKGREGLMN